MKRKLYLPSLLLCVLSVLIVSCTAGNVTEELSVCTCEEWGVCTCGDYCNCNCSVCNQIVDQDEIVKLDIGGFEVEILKVITTHQGSKDAVAQFKKDVQALAELVPAQALAKLQAHTIHVVDDYYRTIRYAGPDDPDYPNSIVIGNIGFYKNTVTRNQPVYLLRFFAELYWDKYVSDSQKATVSSAFAAIGTKYDLVHQSNGAKLEATKVTSPAKNDVLTYFLELSEAYFDGNDYYPFDYAELERHDAAGFDAVAAAWGERTIAPNPYGVILPPVGFTVGNNKTLDVWHRKLILADCNGYSYPIVGSRFVADSCFAQAKAIIEKMSTDKTGTTWMAQAMASNKSYGYYIVIAAKGELFSETPEFRGNTSMDGAYGYGSTPGSSSLIIVETDICGPGVGGVKLGQSLLGHEFGHNIEDGLSRVNPVFATALTDLYTKNITTNGMYGGTGGVYASIDYREY